MQEVTRATRFINFTIDTIIIAIISGIFYVGLGQKVNQQVIFVPAILLYYTLLEGITQRTIGKLVTRTKVVRADGTKPHLGQILIRSLLRLNPFDWLSYAFGSGAQGTHDALSRTYLTSAEEAAS